MPNDQFPMTNNKKYNLRERTTEFSKQIIDFIKTLKQDIVTKPIINQLIRSATGIGANYYEADEGSSKKDFTNKISIANKEAKETMYWIEMIAHSVPDVKKQARMLWQEAHELNLIFSAIIRSAKGQKK